MSATVEIKAVTEDTVTVAGYGVLFGGTDLDGETFHQDTEFMLDLVPAKLVLYDHARGSVRHVIGKTTTVTPDERGLWVEAELNRHTDYVEQVMTLVKAGALGWSSGSVGHLTQRSGKSITRWPIIEFSLTPTPAEPRTVGVEIIKSLADVDESYRLLLPEDAIALAEDASVQTDVVKANALIHVEDTVSEERATPEVAEDEQVKSLNNRLDALSETMAQVLQFMQDSPKVKSAGYFTEDGGAADANVKSFGDWLMAVRRNDVTRLAKVYKSVGTKDMTLGTGTQGGYLVPPEYGTRLMQLAATQSQITGRVTLINVNSDSGAYPVLDQYIVPTAGSGNSAMAAGITANVTAEGALLTETQAGFEDLQYRVYKVGGFTEVTNELISDSPQAIETLLSQLFGIAIAAKNERNILRGTGAGEPLGILNATCAVGISPNTNNEFKWEDALTMVSRFKSAGGTPVWLIHPSIWPDIGAMESSAGGSVWQANMTAGSPSTLLSYPILVSEHLPQANNAGAVMLADLSAYLWFQREGLQIAYSEHAAFTTDKGTWRFTQRVDGKPWLRSAITMSDPQGSYTVSPFVYHND